MIRGNVQSYLTNCAGRQEQKQKQKKKTRKTLVWYSRSMRVSVINYAKDIAWNETK
jgi:hypothetical protein